MRRLDLEYIEGEKVLAKATLDYGDVAIEKSRLRLPTSGTVIGWPTGATGLVVTEVEAAVTLRYTDFERVHNGDMSSSTAP
jgi:hypothetical protein